MSATGTERMTAAHRIRRLRWNARASNVGDALALRLLLRERGDAVQAALDRALEGAAVGDEVVHLIRLDLRLSALSLSALAEDFEQEIELAARDSVQLALRDARADRNGDRPASAEASRHSSVVARRDSLRHYLVTGAFDWTLAGIAPEAAAQALRQAASEVFAEDAAVERLLGAGATAAQRIGALLRWLRLLAPAQRRAWVAGVTRDDDAAPIGAALARVRAELDGAPAALDVLQAFWLGWPVAPTAAYRRRWLREVVDWAVAPSTPANRALAQLVSALRAEIASAPAAASVEAEPTVSPQPAQAADATMLVPLAGLVLLHPYLPRLLAACGITSPNGRDLAADALPRACALLHWLASGHDEAPEYDLPLIKLLLGAAPDAPLDAAPPHLDAHDRVEAQALLATIPTHWSALKGTGLDGLRLSFLQRRGLLARADGCWKLRVQGESFDLLLSTLPWGIGLIRLPWMRQALQVEWETP